MAKETPRGKRAVGVPASEAPYRGRRIRENSREARARDRRIAKQAREAERAAARAKASAARKPRKSAIELERDRTKALHGSQWGANTLLGTYWLLFAAGFYVLYLGGSLVVDDVAVRNEPGDGDDFVFGAILVGMALVAMGFIVYLATSLRRSIRLRRTLSLRHFSLASAVVAVGMLGYLLYRFGAGLISEPLVMPIAIFFFLMLYASLDTFRVNRTSTPA